MLLKENPFYILGASLYDDKAAIQELADEKAWDDEEENGDIYERAATTLTNPKKRLAAEMRWFVGCSREEEKNFVKALDDGMHYGTRLENYFLARLNFKIYALGLNRDPIIYDLIQDIAFYYDKLDAKEIQDTLNEARAEAGFPPIRDTKDITAEIEKIRSEIRTSIQAAFKKLSHRQITTLADELADYIIDGSVILEDFFNKIYSPYVANLLDKHFKKFLDAAISLENNPTESTFQILEKYLQDVCQVLKPMDKVKVISDTDLKNLSEKIFYRLRGIAIDWHNDKHLIDEPLKLLKILSANYLHVDALKKIADKDIKILEEEIAARPSEIFVESEKILRNILDTVHNKTYAKQGFDNENRKFYKEFTQIYASRIFYCLNRSGYKPEELELLHFCAAIIYNEMGIVLTYTPQIDLATKFFETAFEYAKKSNDIKYLKTVEQNLTICRQALSRRQNSGGCMIFLLAVVTATLLNFI